jgi:4-amino-4-deoxy-L-arabinose transferase-like glycosyltransferase
MDGSSRRIVIAAALVGLALRLAFSLGYWVDRPLTRDEQEYLSLARSLAGGHGFVYDATLAATDTFGRAPGYPAFLALAGGGGARTSSVPAPVKIAQSIVGALAIPLVAVIAARLAGPAAGAAAAAIAAIYPPLAWISDYALSEVLFLPLGLLTALLVDEALARRKGDAGVAFAAGLAGGVAVLVRPGMVFFFLLAAVVLLVRRRAGVVVALAIGSLLVVLPWMLRNQTREGRFTIATEGGITFWTGNHPLAVGDGDMAANPAIKVDRIALRARHPGLTEAQMEPIYYREALTWMREHPLDWLALEARKAFYLVVPAGPSYRVHSTLYVTASIVSYGLVLALAIGGLRRLGGRWSQATGLWLLAGSAVLGSLVFFPQERFRIPVIDPTLIVLAGVAVAGWRARLSA